MMMLRHSEFISESPQHLILVVKFKEILKKVQGDVVFGV